MASEKIDTVSEDPSSITKHPDGELLSPNDQAFHASNMTPRDNRVNDSTAATNADDSGNENDKEKSPDGVNIDQDAPERISSTQNENEETTRIDQKTQGKFQSVADSDLSTASQGSTVEPAQNEEEQKTDSVLNEAPHSTNPKDGDLPIHSHLESDQINPMTNTPTKADPQAAQHSSSHTPDLEGRSPAGDPPSPGHIRISEQNERDPNDRLGMDTTSAEEISIPEESPDSGPGATPSRQNLSQPHPMEQALGLNFRDQQRQQIYKPDQIRLEDPPGEIDEDLLARIQGSIVGMALGDALGAHVEFRPHEYLKNNPVSELQGGGTWGLQIGQFTDDTSMALCLANSLIVCGDFLPYDQLVRYKWWYRHGYMSSTGHCFDIGNATRESVVTFEDHQKKLARKHGITSEEEIDRLRDPAIHRDEVIYCSEKGVAGNGALMRLGPVPLFFYQSPEKAVEYAGISGQITHGDPKARDACRYYAALIVAALQGYSKEQLLDKNFYSDHKDWFGKKKLESDVKAIARGSYQNAGGYEGGIRGKGYIVKALEAALWAFWSNDTFEEGAKAAVNLGDDTDTTAAIYGQLAGVVYQYEGLPQRWCEKVYAPRFLEQLSKWIAYEGNEWYKRQGEKTESN